MKPDNYFIEVNDNRYHAICLACTIGAAIKQRVNLGTDTLRPTGFMQGSINQGPTSQSAAVYVQIYGLDRVAKVNPVTGSFSFDMLPPGDFSLHVLSSSPATVPAVDIGSVAVPQGDTATVPFALWKLSRKLYFNTTSTGAQVAGTVTGFPVLVRLTKSNFSFNEAQPFGQDIRFAKVNGLPLPYEIERWDSANAQAEIWVRLDTVFGNDQSRYMTMFWGNPNAASGSNGAAVFDTSSGFQGVWHLGEAGNTTAPDATLNHYNGIPSGMTAASAVPGAIGIAQGFDGKSTCISIPNSDYGKLDYPEKGVYTLSAWVFLDSLYPEVIIEKGDSVPSDYCIRVGTAKKYEFYEQADAQQGWDERYAAASTGEWKLVTGVRNGAKGYFYVDGICVDSVGSIEANNYHRTPTGGLAIGRNYARSINFLKGAIDEVRVLNTAPNADWIKLCYMNQKSVDALIVFK